MKSVRTTLPPELTFRADGHASDLVLDAVADGELDFVDEQGLDHLDGCDLCTRRLGEAAMVSLRAGTTLRKQAQDALAAPVNERLARPGLPRRRPLPFFAIAAALAIAALCGGTSFVDWARELKAAPDDVRVTASVALHFLLLLARGAWEPSAAAIAAQWIAAGLFVVIGLTIAARVTRRRSLEGET